MSIVQVSALSSLQVLPYVSLCSEKSAYLGRILEAGGRVVRDVCG